MYTLRLQIKSVYQNWRNIEQSCKMARGNNLEVELVKRLPSFILIPIAIRKDYAKEDGKNSTAKRDCKKVVFIII